MSSLRQLQGDFQDYLMGRDEAGAAPPAIAAAVREQYGLKAHERLAIYHRAYRSRLREALCESFDKTWSYLGDAMFAELADSYVDAHPSRDPNLRWFGGQFAAHAAHTFGEHPYIAELARFEWALGLAFDADDAPPLGAAELAALAPEAWGELRFGLHPSAQLLPMRWNTVALWQALKADAPPPDPAPSDQLMCWLVWRSADQPHFRSLPAAEAEALRRISLGATFGEVCEAACARAGGDDAMLALAGYLQHWLAQGVLVARYRRTSVNPTPSST